MGLEWAIQHASVRRKHRKEERNQQVWEDIARRLPSGDSLDAPGMGTEPLTRCSMDFLLALTLLQSTSVTIFIFLSLTKCILYPISHQTLCHRTIFQSILAPTPGKGAMVPGQEKKKNILLLECFKWIRLLVLLRLLFFS